MKSFLVSGNDTDIGKSQVVASLCSLFKDQSKVQLVKPLQSGCLEHENDLTLIQKSLGNPSYVDAHTLHSFKAALSPIDAASQEGVHIDFNTLKQQIQSLPETPIRIIEGAGGLAVPVAHDFQDWLDLAHALQVDYLILVVDNRLGTIHQSKSLYHYSQKKSPTIETGIVLSEPAPCPPEVHQSNFKTLQAINIPIWGLLKHQCSVLETFPIGPFLPN